MPSHPPISLYTMLFNCPLGGVIVKSQGQFLIIIYLEPSVTFVILVYSLNPCLSLISSCLPYHNFPYISLTAYHSLWAVSCPSNVINLQEFFLAPLRASQYSLFQDDLIHAQGFNCHLCANYSQIFGIGFSPIL